MSLSRRHLRRQLRALEWTSLTQERWAAWRRRFGWVAILASLSLWLQHRLASRIPTGALGAWLMAMVAVGGSALIEAGLSRARVRRRALIDRTERAIGHGPGPYRVSPVAARKMQSD